LNINKNKTMELLQFQSEANYLIAKFENLIECMPQNGNTSSECQRVAIQGAINQLSYTINGTSEVDLLTSKQVLEWYKEDEPFTEGQVEVIEAMIENQWLDTDDIIEDFQAWCYAKDWEHDVEDPFSDFGDIYENLLTHEENYKKFSEQSLIIQL
jgi:hypothetical protein